MPYNPNFTNPEGLNPNAFGAGLGVYSQAVTTAYDIYTPQELVQLFEQHNKPAGYRVMLKAMGFSRGVKAPTTGHYEAPWKKDHLVVGSAADNGGGQFTVTLAAASMFTFTDAAGGTQSASYPIIGDILELPNRKRGRISAKNATVNPNTVTVDSVDSTNLLIAGDWVANQRVFISDNAWGEGMPLPGSRQSRVTKYTNTFQIIADAVSSTGSELTNQTYFEPIPGVEGSFFLKGIEDCMFRHDDATDNALIFGTQIDNVTETPPQLGYPVAVRGTEGLIDFGITSGYDRTWDPAVGYEIQDLDDVTAIYEGERVGTNELMCWQGFQAYQAVENALFDYTKQTEVSVTNSETGEKTTITIDIYAIQKSGYRIVFKKLDCFNDVKGGGTTGYDYPLYNVFTPVGFTKDKSSGARTGTIGYEWKQLGGYSRENVVIKLDGTGYGPVATQSDDVHTMGIRSEIAAHNACANQVVIQRPL